VLDALITSKTRIKLLLKFFLNSSHASYLRNLETEFGESSNAVRVELNRFESAGLLNSFTKGNRKYFQANDKHPLFADIHNIILKYVGIDKIIENVAQKLGDLDRVFLTGDFAKGTNNGVIDLVFIGESLNKEYLVRLVDKAEKLISHKVRYMVLTTGEFETYKKNMKAEEVLLLWKA
jgi:hypothetical protein